MKSSIKYGLWIAGIYLVMFSLTRILTAFSVRGLTLWIGIPTAILSIPGIILSFIFFGSYDALYNGDPIKIAVYVILAILFYFLIGMGIGKLVDKVKSKRE